MSGNQKKLPKSVHLRMGGYKDFPINEEANLTVYVTSCFKIVDHLVRERLSPIVSRRDPAVIAIDSKLRNRNCSMLLSGGYVVLCVPNNTCLVVRVRGEGCLDWLKRYLLCMPPHRAAAHGLPASLKKLLEGHERVCLVGAKDPHMYCRGIGSDVGVKLGHLAARIRMRPELYSSEDLKLLATEVLGENSYDDSVVNCGRGGRGQAPTNQPETQLQPQSGQSPIDQSQPEPQSGQAIVNQPEPQSGQTIVNQPEPEAQPKSQSGEAIVNQPEPEAQSGQATVNQPESKSERAARYWDGQVFSEDELKALVYDSYITYKIGEKLLAVRADTRRG